LSFKKKEGYGMENRKAYLKQKIQEIQRKQTKNIEDSKKKRKKIFTGIGAGVVAAAIAITGLVHVIKRNKKNINNNKPTYSTIDTTPTIVPEKQASIDDLGVPYANPTLPTKKPQYGNTTGNIKKEDLTEKNNTTWKDKEAANNSSNVGKTEIDDKNGTLEVKPNGDVFVKEEGYEIKKEDGTVIEGTITESDKQDVEIGTNGTVLPPGYVHDENLDKDVVEEDVNKFVYCDSNYYDSTGQLVYEKGELISKDDLELAKQLLTITKPVIETQPEIVVPETTVPETIVPETTVPETTITEETFVPTQGVVNADGTYTIDGITFESKADYEQWVIQGYEGYGMDLDGIMKPEDEIIANYNQKSK